METKGQRLLRFLITGALDEAIWGWLSRGLIVSAFTALWGWLTELPTVAVFVYSFWAFIGVIFLLAGLKWVFRVMPKQAINVDFFEERPPTSWYRDKIESARTVWAAYIGGGAMDSSEILNSKNFRKLILLNPDSDAFKAIRDMESQKPLHELQDTIRRNTNKAIKLNCDVRWCGDIAYSLLTIGNPPDVGRTPPNDMWVIIETYIAGIEAEKRPSIFVEWSKNQRMADKALSSFTRLWEHARPASLSNPHKEDSQS